VVLGRARSEFGASPSGLKEIEMSTSYPVVPVVGGTIIRAFASVLALVTHWVKELLRARKHRRQAKLLAGFDNRMLADIGITRSDVRDAFSEPFWDDPTSLLRERALERRIDHAVRRAEFDRGMRHFN